MRSATLLVFVAVLAAAAAVGQYYVPRAYYTIDDEGHASNPVPLRRLRRSLGPYPWGGGSSANANADAHAHADGWGDANANANANAVAYAGAGAGRGAGAPGAEPPLIASLGASRPVALASGGTARQFGPITGAHSVLASSSVGLDSTGNGYYDQTASTH